MPNIKLGQYVYGKSFLHLLDPRSKIICCLIIVISVLINYSWYYLTFLLLLMAIAMIMAGMNVRFISTSLRSIRYLLLITFIFQAFLTPGESIWETGPLSVTLEGLMAGTVNLMRLLILYFGSIVLLMTTSPVQLSTGIEYLLLPLSKLNVPVHNFSTILGISFRFLPTLVEEATIIKKAQSSRGAQFDAPQIMVRLKSFLAILIPLFEASLSRSEELGDAMDSRCYTTRPNRLRLSRLKWNTQDSVILILVVLVMLVGLILP